ncbi:MAG: OB-fold protein [Aeromonas sp.]
MPLIQCPDCNKEMSDTAPTCPNCGRPNTTSTPAHSSVPKDVPSRKVGFLLLVGIVFFPLLFAWFTLRNGYSTKSRVISFGWLVLCVVMVFAGETETPSSTEQSASTSQPSQQTQQDDAVARQQAIDALPVITSQALSAAYDENTVAADQKFKGKQFKVKGTVTEISTDIMGDPYITLKGTNMFQEPQFQFDKDATDQLARLKKGITVVLICTGRGDIAKTPMSDDCFMQ